MGYNYTPYDIQEYMGFKSGATPTELKNYLNSVGLSCTTGRTGYLIFSDVINIIYHDDSYIFIGASNVDTDVGHAFVILVILLMG